MSVFYDWLTDFWGILWIPLLVVVAWCVVDFIIEYLDDGEEDKSAEQGTWPDSDDETIIQ